MATRPRSALVLVAASHQPRRDAAIEVVGRMGHRVLEAIDGLHALALATRYIPDLVIADAVMPRIDGLDLIARMKQNPDTADIAAILAGERGTAATDHASIPLVATREETAQAMQRLLAARTTASQRITTLRRALADVRATAAERADGGLPSHARARQIANGAEESMISVLIADDNARLVEANAAICALSGYSRAELLGMTAWDLSADNGGDDRDRLWERFKRSGRFEGPYRIRRRTGESITIRCAASANVVPGLHVSTMAPARLLEVIGS